MKKFAMLAAVLLGTAAASQAGIDVHIGIPFPPMPRVIIGYPAPVVIVPGPRYCPPPVVVAPPHCAPVYAYPAYPHGYRHGHGYSHGHRHGGYNGHGRGGRDYSRGGHHGHR